MVFTAATTAKLAPTDSPVAKAKAGDFSPAFQTAMRLLER
jgi:hypothetical protein